MTASVLPTNSFVPTDYIIPSDEAQRLVRLRQYFNDLAAALNVKDFGAYQTDEVLCGQQFLPSATTGTSNVIFRDVFRIVVPTGALSTGANTVAHGLSPTSTWHFSRIYGVIEDTTVPEWVPIPNATVEVTIDATNINITIPAGFNGYSGQVVLEYVKTD